jgi:hypothetical protein
MKTPHNNEEKERRRMKPPHEDAKIKEHRSHLEMKMTESKNAPIDERRVRGHQSNPMA